MDNDEKLNQDIFPIKLITPIMLKQDPSGLTIFFEPTVQKFYGVLEKRRSPFYAEITGVKKYFKVNNSTEVTKKVGKEVLVASSNSYGTIKLVTVDKCIITGATFTLKDELGSNISGYVRLLEDITAPVEKLKELILEREILISRYEKVIQDLNDNSTKFKATYKKGSYPTYVYSNNKWSNGKELLSKLEIIK